MMEDCSCGTDDSKSEKEKEKEIIEYLGLTYKNVDTKFAKKVVYGYLFDEKIYKNVKKYEKIIEFLCTRFIFDNVLRNWFYDFYTKCIMNDDLLIEMNKYMKFKKLRLEYRSTCNGCKITDKSLKELKSLEHLEIIY